MGNHNPGKSLPRDAVKFSRSGPEANRSDSAGSPLKPQNGRVLRSPLESRPPPLTPEVTGNAVPAARSAHQT